MTLKAIKAMFQPGQRWNADNTYMPQANGIRTVGHIHSAKMTWVWPDGRIGWMDFPKASQVIEARDGFLSFRLFSTEDAVKYRKPGALDAIVSLTLTR